MEEIRTDNTETLKNALERIKELEKENAELKSIADFQTSSNMDRYFQLKRNKERLTKAKGIIQSFVWWHTGEDRGSIDSNDLVERAEQFLKEASE